MSETTMSPQEITELTMSRMVPGAHIEVAFQKLGLDASRFLRGDTPDRGYNGGFYSASSPLVMPAAFPAVLESLYEIKRGDTGKSYKIAAALVENLVTRNDITNEELSFLYSIAREGGEVALSYFSEATPGMKKALGGLVLKGMCQECSFKIPKYSGRYPKTCPKCGKPLTVISEVARSVFVALNVLNDRIRMIEKFGLKRDLVETTYTLPEDSTPVQRAIIGDPSAATPREIFEGLTSHLVGPRQGRFTNLVQNLYGKHPLGGEMTSRLRQEVFKRTALVKSIRSLSEGDEERRFFVLTKALSSCLTRVMIEGETQGGEDYKFLGECIFEMMQRAFEGDLTGPSRFLSTFFLEG